MVDVCPGVKPFLKWVGGKRQLLPELRKYLGRGAISHYMEPFVGGGAVLFDLMSSGRLQGKISIYDANDELMRCYTAIRDNVEQVIIELQRMPYEEQRYYAIRAYDQNPDPDPYWLAARTIYLNKCGFNGLYRVNAKGLFNVPFGRYVNPTICDTENLRAVSAALQKAHISTADFSTIKEDMNGALIYCDPPYWPVSKTANFTAYQAGGFGPEQQKLLRDKALEWAACGARVVLSNADVSEVRTLYEDGFEIHAVEARRAVNSKSDKRGKVGELIMVAKS